MNIILFHPGELTVPLLRNDPRNRHIRRILKSSEGDALRVGVINGNRGTAIITRITSEEIHLRFHLEEPSVPLHRIRLLCGLPRPQQAKRILRDCASMGVSHIWFVHTELGEKSYRHSPIWQNDAYLGFVREGIEQSGGTMFPEVRIFENFSSGLAGLPENCARFVFDVVPPSPRPIPGSLTNPSGPEIAVIIGSERGWTDRERGFLNDSGCRPFSLGSRILRTDTACIAAVTLALLPVPL